MNTRFSQILAASFFVFTSASIAHADDSGDHACQVFIVDALKVNSGTYGSFVTTDIAVKKELVQGKGDGAQVAVHYRVGPGPNDFKDVVGYSDDEQNGYLHYLVQFSYGTVDDATPIELTAFASDGKNRLFDNNHQTQNVTLELNNNFKYHTACKY